MPTYRVEAGEAGERLDRFLQGKIGQLTRSQLQKRIKAGQVLVNDELPAVHRFLKAGDTVTANLAEIPAAGKKAARQERSSAALREVAVVSETEDFYVLDKPADLLVHPASDSTERTLVDWLLERYPPIAKVGEDPLRPGIVHRLDREVSGLLVVAKNQAMFDCLKEQFQKRSVQKVYTALVYGVPQKNEGEISFNIDRSETADHKMAAVPTREPRGRRAVTEFELTRRYGSYSLLTVRPRTGRTHQIRVHLNAYGLPIVGDLVYRPRNAPHKIKMSRIFLHAGMLGFRDLEGGWREFKSPLPAELQTVLEALPQG